MKRALPLSGMLCAISMMAGNSVFEREMLAKPEIKVPDKPFVTVFLEGGNDNNTYGFRSGGELTADDWAKIFKHVGYITAYSDFKPGQGWSAQGRDIAVKGALQAGRREIGGSIMGCPQSDLEATSARAAYDDEIGSKITHFFHDYEPHYGSVGGEGKFRLSYNVNIGGQFGGQPSQDFNPGVGKAMESFKIAFDFNLENYIYGGSLQLLNCSDNNFTSGKTGWTISIYNEGSHSGTTRLIFSGRGTDGVNSALLKASEGRVWHHIEIYANGSSKTDEMDVTIKIDEQFITNGKIKRPYGKDWTLFFGSAIDKTEERVPCFDNLSISGIVDGKTNLLASFPAEKEMGYGVTKNQPVKILEDVSGRNNHLRPLNPNANGWKYEDNSGVDDKMYGNVKQYLVDDIIKTRTSRNLPQPEMITNWLLGDVSGRFNVWKKAGFTHPSISIYNYGDVKPKFANMTDMFRPEVGMFLKREDANWYHAWLGVCNSEITPTPEQWQTVMTLATLNGIRWYSVFTAMSNGHLGSKSWTDAAKMATANAACIYAMAQTASWFQPYAASLQESELTSLPEAKDFKGIFQTRKNMKTGEMWFAAWSLDASNLPVKLSASQGTVTNLKTGEKKSVTDGIFILPVSETSVPYYFQK